MTRPHPYAAHELLVRPARQKPEIWRLLVGLVVVVASFLILQNLAGTMLRALFPGFWLREIATSGPIGATPGSMLVLLSGFGFLIVGVQLAGRMLQGRGLSGMFGPARIWLFHFRKVLVGLVLLTLAIAVLPPWGVAEAPLPHLPFATWAGLLPLSLLALMIQVTGEEVLFRGYIQQSLAARFASPWMWMVLPSVLFAIGHYDPTLQGESAWIIAVWAGLFGIALADLTARAGTLGPAMAVHFANNAGPLLFAAPQGAMQGLALYLLPFSLDELAASADWLLFDGMMILITWLVARLAIRR